jgi:hypothetical protein
MFILNFCFIYVIITKTTYADIGETAINIKELLT